MAAFCHGFLDDMDDKSLRADQGGLRADEQCEVRTPEPSLKKLRTLPTDDSLSSEPKHVNTSKAAIKPVSHGSLFKKAKPSNAAVAKSCAVALFQGAHTAPDKKRGKDTCPRADYGTQNTFAGRRPPKDPERRKAFDLMREDYAKLKVDAAKSSKKNPDFPEPLLGLHVSRFGEGRPWLAAGEVQSCSPRISCIFGAAELVPLFVFFVCGFNTLDQGVMPHCARCVVNGVILRDNMCLTTRADSRSNLLGKCAQ